MIENVRVWDFIVRIFHWSLMVLVFTALLTEDDFLDLHVFVGYSVGLSIIIRLFWGLVGPKYARFSNFIYPPKTVISYLRDLKTRVAPRYLGHSPAGGAMVIVLLIVLALTVVTGLASYGAEENAGPLAAYLSASDRLTRGVLANIHNGFANALWVLIALHIGGVIFAGIVHHENLVLSMFTGRKRKH